MKSNSSGPPVRADFKTGMKPMDYHIDQIAQTEDPTLASEIAQRMLAQLAAINTQSKNQELAFQAHSQTKGLFGGVIGQTSYGWLLTKTLWVDSPYQGKGIGQALMTRIHTEARDIGCHSAWLDTSNPTAKSFYEKLGYAVFGSLENTPGQHPADHQRWFLKRDL